MIKTKYIKIITIISLISIFTMQLMWLCNTYILIKDNIYEETNQILYKSIEEEAIIRLNKTPKWLHIESYKSQKQGGASTKQKRKFPVVECHPFQRNSYPHRPVTSCTNDIDESALEHICTHGNLIADYSSYGGIRFHRIVLPNKNHHHRKENSPAKRRFLLRHDSWYENAHQLCHHVRQQAA